MNEWLDAEARLERALQLTDAQRWDEALAELDAAIAINDGEPEWHARRGQILDQLERYDEAITSYRTALGLHPADPEIGTFLGIDLIRTEQYQAAVEVYERLAAAHPDYEPAYCHRIAAYTRLGDHDCAEQMFYLAQQLTNQCPNCYHHIAESLACRDMLNKAIYCWHRALELDPEYPHARRRIAEAFRAQNKHVAAHEHYLAAIRQDPGDLDLLGDLGDLLIEMDDLSAAAAKFQHLLDLQPGSVRARVMLGLIASQRGNAEAAVAHLRAALSLDEAYPGLHSHLGEAELRRGQHDSAMRHLALALEENPEDCIALVGMGNCLLELSRPGEAAAYFERVLNIDPEMVGAHHNLGICRFLERDYDGGIRHWLHALGLDPNNLMVIHKLTLAYIHLGCMKQAKAMLARGLALDPHHSGLVQVKACWWRIRLRQLGRRMIRKGSRPTSAVA